MVQLSTDGAMTTALHQNNATVVTSRTQIFTVAANDYLGGKLYDR